jgi:hypothetical protein
MTMDNKPFLDPPPSLTAAQSEHRIVLVFHFIEHPLRHLEFEPFYLRLIIYSFIQGVKSRILAS